VLFPDQSNDETLRSHVTPEVSAPDPRSLNPDLSEGLVRILSKMCAKDVGDRYEDWKKVLADSEIMQSGGLPEPLPEGVPSSIKANR
jgi:hypothetical protein